MTPESGLRHYLALFETYRKVYRGIPLCPRLRSPRSLTLKHHLQYQILPGHS